MEPELELELEVEVELKFELDFPKSQFGDTILGSETS